MKSLSIVTSLHCTMLVYAHRPVIMAVVLKCALFKGTNLQTAAVQISNSRNITLTNIQVANSGGFGVWPRYNCVDVTMSRITVNDVGSGAVRIGDLLSNGSGSDRTNNSSIGDVGAGNGGDGDVGSGG